MAKSKKNRKSSTNNIRAVTDELKDIKRILILALIKQGIKSKDIAQALNIDPSVITRMVPSRSK
ncbi:MAG TPA: helix-turn-helix domain-containing protein [bacterium]